MGMIPVRKSHRVRRRMLDATDQATTQSAPLRPWVAVAAFVGYALLSVILTYPLVANLATAVKDHGDPLLNAWILAWETHWLTTGQLSGFLDANMFYPYERTLAYSELLLTQSLLALPLQLVAHNPILSYNILVLLAMTTSAFGCFLLATHLTGQPLAGMVAGLVFAYCPFMFDHLSHLQVLSAGGIPMTLFFLHRFQETRRTSTLLLCALFYLLQVFANGYYALYLTLIAGLFLLHNIASRSRWTDTRMWRQLLLVVVLLIAVAGPVLFPYLSTHREMGFVRSITTQASLTSYVATSPRNLLYGDLTSGVSQPEANLFPGALALVLALLGAVSGLRFGQSYGSLPGPGGGSARQALDRHVVLTAFDLGILFFGGVVIVILVTGGGAFSLLGWSPPNNMTVLLRVSAVTVIKPGLWMVALIVARVVARRVWLPGRLGIFEPLGWRWPILLDLLIGFVVGYIIAISVVDLPALGVRESLDGESAVGGALLVLFGLLVGRYLLRATVKRATWGRIPRFRGPLGLYLAILLVAFLFSFGSEGPYILLYRYVPGFDGLRAAGRIAVVVMLALAVIGAHGTARLLRRYTAGKRRALALSLGLILCAEYLSVPIPSQAVPVDRDVPEVYRWLSSQDGQFSIVEYPFQPMGRTEGLRLYYSTYHWKDLVNGYSGYFPPLFLELRRLSPEFPSETTIRVLEAIGVRFVILDSARYADDWARVRTALTSYRNRLRFVRRFDETHVYEVTGRTEGFLDTITPSRYGEALSFSMVTASVNDGLTGYLTDGDVASRWTGGPQTPGQEISIDLGTASVVGALIMELGPYRQDYPRDLVIETSVDGTDWSRSWAGPTQSQALLATLVSRHEMPLVFPLGGRTARWVRLRQLGADPAGYYWSIGELSVVAPTSQGRPSP